VTSTSPPPSAPTKPAKPTAPAHPVDQVVATYGDVIFDLCESVLWNSTNAQLAFRKIVKELRKSSSHEQFSVHERAWVLRVSCDRLRDLAQNTSRRMTASERIESDATETTAGRLKKFDFYFHRLTLNDQFLLLLRDKYGFAYSEISTALGIPEGSLKTSRQQALRALEEWVWDQS